VALGDLTLAQRHLLDRLIDNALVERFYLSGGTALAAFHLHHRSSDDLDLFTRDPVDTRAVLRLVSAVADEPPVPRRQDDRFGFLLRVGGEPLRVEFVRYDFDHLDPPERRYGTLRVDGLRDILANKLSAMVERTEPKDFADVLFILRQPGFSLELGMEDCRKKFGWPGLRYLLQAAFLRPEQFKSWVTTDPPVTLNEARAFFRDLARSLIRVGGSNDG
jgi:Nucleotidyl transferase AbiEii toxin, Type IV TA system